MSQFIFVRHGQSKANADMVIAEAYSELTEKGVRQARETAQKVRNFNITTILCSPYQRAKQTAEILASELNIDKDHIKIIDELHERDLGSLKNKLKEHEGLWYFTDDETEGIEKRAELLRRMSVCLERIRQESKEGETVLVVGHAIAGFYLLQVCAKKVSLQDFDLPLELHNAEYMVVEY
jgi:broad specificity phosphatase PhoE